MELVDGKRFYQVPAITFYIDTHTHTNAEIDTQTHLLENKFVISLAAHSVAVGRIDLCYQMPERMILMQIEKFKRKNRQQ